MMTGLVETALAKLIERTREIERRLDFDTVGRSKWELIRAGDEAQAVLDAAKKERASARSKANADAAGRPARKAKQGQGSAL